MRGGRKRALCAEPLRGCLPGPGMRRASRLAWRQLRKLPRRRDLPSEHLCGSVRGRSLRSATRIASGGLRRMRVRSSLSVRRPLPRDSGCPVDRWQHLHPGWCPLRFRLRRESRPVFVDTQDRTAVLGRFGPRQRHRLRRWHPTGWARRFYRRAPPAAEHGRRRHRGGERHHHERPGLGRRRRRRRTAILRFPSALRAGCRRRRGIDLGGGNQGFGWRRGSDVHALHVGHRRWRRWRHGRRPWRTAGRHRRRLSLPLRRKSRPGERRGGRHRRGALRRRGRSGPRLRQRVQSGVVLQRYRSRLHPRSGRR